MKRLAKTADIIIETFPPGYLGGLGLGYESLKQDNPGLIMTSVTNFGQTGPYKDYKASDMVGYAMGGLMYIAGYDDAPPIRAGGHQAYIVAAVQAAAATMMAVVARRNRGGEGLHIDISMQEAVAAISNLSGISKYLDDKVVPARAIAKAQSLSGHLKTKDGGYVCITIARSRMWPVLAQWVHEVTGNEAILAPRFEGSALNRQIHADEIGAIVADFVARFNKDELCKEGQRRRLAVAVVSSPRDLAENEQLKFRNFYVDIDHPSTGKLRYPGAPYRLSETPWAARRPAPTAGQHNREVFVQELGLSPGEMERLARKGVI